MTRQTERLVLFITYCPDRWNNTMSNKDCVTWEVGKRGHKLGYYRQVSTVSIGKEVCPENGARWKQIMCPMLHRELPTPELGRSYAPWDSNLVS